MDGIYIEKSLLIGSLWAEYIKSCPDKTTASLLRAIPRDHPIVIRREKQGLTKIINVIARELSNAQQLYLDTLKYRKRNDWVDEWKQFHNHLFSYVLRQRGDLRRQNVRIGSPEEEQLFAISDERDVSRKTFELADQLTSIFQILPSDQEARIEMLAMIHANFIRVHPFDDGNGRIGRVLVDQISLAMGMPMVLASYPRSEPHQQAKYHSAIREALVNNNLSLLCDWIGNRLKEVTFEG